MRTLSRLFSQFVLVCAFVCAFSAAAVATPSVQMMSIDDVRPGMRGYGLTVFRGTEPERFDVEVVDVIHRFRPDQDMILIRTPHPVLDRVNIVAGMSGSPIYLDNKLVGAYAFGWPFGNEPIAGVTPIANMLNDMRRPTRPNSFFGSNPLAALSPRQPPRNLADTLPFGADDGEPTNGLTAIRALRNRLAPQRAAASSLGMEAAATPLWVGGLPDDVVAMLETELAPMGLIPVQAGGAGATRADPTAPTGYVDGGAIAIQIARGDIALTAIGTVTYVDPGGRLVAFGHPMMEQGEVGLPSAVARVAHVMSSVQRSFKIGEAVRPLGTLIHDRQTSIVIDTHRAPAVVPIHVHINGVPGDQRTDWNVEVASHRAITPTVTLAVIQAAIKSSAADQTFVSFRARTEMTIAGYGPISITDEGAVNAGPGTMPLASLRAFSLFEIVFGNPFVESRVERVDFNIDFTFEQTTMTLIDARVPDAEVESGDTVHAILTFRRFGQPDLVRTIDVVVPERLAGQTVRLDLRPANMIPRPVGRADTFAALIDTVRDAHPATELAATFDMPGRSMAFPMHVAQELPGSALDALSLAHSAVGSNAYAVQTSTYFPMGAVVVGNAGIELHVARTRLSRSLVP